MYAQNLSISHAASYSCLKSLHERKAIPVHTNFTAHYSDCAGNLDAGLASELRGLFPMSH